MSDTLSKAQAFSFETTETHDRVRRNGEKTQVQFTRQVVVRRPDKLTLHQSGADRDFNVWYDGKALTVVGNRQKIYAKTDVPNTLDAMLDYVSDRLDVPLVMGDVLYSNPYDSFIGEGTTGGWVSRTEINGRSCEQLRYEHKTVDFALSVASAAPVLPCRLEITYKDTPGQPVSRVSFDKWNLNAQVADTQFTATIPPNYEEIPIVERFKKSEVTLDGKSAAAGAASKPAAPSPATKK
jgi:hypothetical protein